MNRMEAALRDIAPALLPWWTVRFRRSATAPVCRCGKSTIRVPKRGHALSHLYTLRNSYKKGEYTYPPIYFYCPSCVAADYEEASC